jgi:aldehyde:ferredoxin oxidoreductase
MKKIYRVDMFTMKVTVEDSPPEYDLLGGRGLISKIMAKEVPPTCHPLGRDNKVIIAPGLLCGSHFPSAGRLSVGFKSPMTKGIKESNVGGTAGNKLGNLDIKAIIIENKPIENKKFYILKIDSNALAILPGDEIVGLNNSDTVKKLSESYGEKVSICAIAKSGELKMMMATMSVTDLQGRPTRQCGRGGAGAVLGSKGVKAIVIDDMGTKPARPKEGDAFKDLALDYADFVKNSKSAQAYNVQGTMGGGSWVSDKNNSLPTRNFTAGQFDGMKNMAHRSVVERMKTEGSKWGVPCMAGCLVACSNRITDKEGNWITSGLEYETVAMMGSNLGIDDIYAVARMDKLADDMGLDSIELGAALGVVCDAGLCEFGDSKRALELIDEIDKATPLGLILGQGAATVATCFGISRVPVVKGQAIPAHEPRVENGTGVTYTTSAMGADHTAGMVLMRQPDSDAALAASKESQIVTMMVDSLGLCINAFKDPGYPMDKSTQIAQAMFGKDFNYDSLRSVAITSLLEERAFNFKAGVGPATDKLPEWFRDEVSPPSGHVFDVPQEKIDSFWNELE